ncbi:hypothetical protein IAU60_006458 [Kwoniella sp. DSM 27419]
MAFQSPLIAIPKKTTQDVDWTNPIRSIIAHSYGEDPNTYSEECSVLQRCRQDAVRGAGSDQTARDLLYKYFGQLELLELRFAEIKTSLAFEKASIIHLISSVLSSLAQSPSRSDPEGLKRAYYNTRASAGMLTYINENFLHAPSTDLSREVVHLCIAIMIAQATEIFTEKLVDEKKSPALVSRSANSTAAFYATALDEMKEFQGKGVFDRNWLYVLQIKAKLFASLAQYYKAVADSAAGKHGPALVRFRVADAAAQEAHRQANTFAYTFIASTTPSLPHDAATSLQEICKAHAAVCTEAKDQAVKDNDLIYHEVLPSEAALPAIEKLPAAAPITIQEVYGNPDVTKLIGPDIFIRLIPLAVHESASVYSEEKAKLVRAEVERVEISEGEIRAGLEHLGLPGQVTQWRNLAEDQAGTETEVEISSQIRRLAEDVSRGGSVEASLRQLQGDRERCEGEFRQLSALLDNESRECERMRAKYTPQFAQSPSGPQTAQFRSNIASNLAALASAGSSDANLSGIYQAHQRDIALLASGVSAVENVAAQVAAGKQSAPKIDQGMSLLDLQEDVGVQTGLSEPEKEELKKAVADASEKLDRLGKIRRERDEVLKDLKEKLQTDDVSNLLLLNRRSSGVEPQLFASELEKFRPYQGRLASAVQASSSLLQELEMLVQQVGKGKGVRELQKGSKDRSRRVRDWERKLVEAGEAYAEIQAGLSKGTTYYDSLLRVLEDLRREVKGFVNSRDSERNRIVGEIETRQRLGTSPPPPSTGTRSLEDRLAALSVAPSSTPSYAPPPPQPPRSYASPPLPSGFPPPPAQVSTPSFAPPPPPAKAPGPYDFTGLSSASSVYSATSPAPQSPSHHVSPQQSFGSSSYYSRPGGQAPAQGQASSHSPYPPPPSQPPRPSTHEYGSYGQPSHPSSQASGYSGSYPSMPPQPSYQTSAQAGYSSPPPPPQPSYSQQPYGQSQYSAAPPQPSHPQQSHPGAPPPPGRPTYSSPPPPQQQYPNYPPPTGGYNSFPPPQSGQGQGQQGYGYNGYPYR